MQFSHKHILGLLCVDLLVSALYLVAVLGARRTTEAFATEEHLHGAHSVSSSVALEPASSTKSEQVFKQSGQKEGVSGEVRDIQREAELRALRRDIQASKARIEAEVDRQSVLVDEKAIRTECKELSLAEFREKFPEEYRNFLDRRKAQRRLAKMFLEKHKRALALLETGVLADEEYDALRTAYEYLIECDERAVEGRPVLVLPENFPERKELLELLETYAQRKSGATEVELKSWQSIDSFELGQFFVPQFILDKAVIYREGEEQ